MPDLELINRHLAELRAELSELHQSVDQTAQLKAEAVLEEVFSTLKPAISALVDKQAGLNTDVDGALTSALRELGLEQYEKKDTILDLWPDQAREDYHLDRDVPLTAELVRVRITAEGWRRGFDVVVRARAKVLEIVEDGNHGSENPDQ